jgi:excisionase family DNA binding protein
MSIEKKFFNTDEAAEYMGFATYTLRRWRHEGAGHGPRYYKVRRRVRYALEDLESFLKQTPRNSTER